MKILQSVSMLMLATMMVACSAKQREKSDASATKPVAQEGTPPQVETLNGNGAPAPTPVPNKLPPGAAPFDTFQAPKGDQLNPQGQKTKTDDQSKKDDAGANNGKTPTNPPAPPAAPAKPDAQGESEKSPKQSEKQPEKQNQKSNVGEAKVDRPDSTSEAVSNGLASSYVLASNDILVQTLSKQLKQETDAQKKKANLLAAARITNVNTKVITKDDQQKAVQVELSIKSDKKAPASSAATVVVVADLDEKMEATIASTVVSQTQDEVSGRVLCLDKAKNKCFVSLLDLTVKSKTEEARVFVVVRKTQFDVKVLNVVDGGRVSEAAQSLLKVIETSRSRETGEHFSAAQSESFEVVNGKSHARFTLVSSEGQVLSFHSDLLTDDSTKSSLMNVVMDQDIRPTQVQDFLKISDIKTDLSTAVTEARLTQVRSGRAFVVDMDLAGRDENTSASQLMVEFVRLHPATNPVKF